MPGGSSHFRIGSHRTAALRFDLAIEIGLPDDAGRLAILRIHTKKLYEVGAVAPSVNLTRVAADTERCVYAGPVATRTAAPHTLL